MGLSFSSNYGRFYDNNDVFALFDEAEFWEAFVWEIVVPGTF
jgi:hypothetical protein